MCDETVSTYHCSIDFVPEYYKTQERCDEVVNRCFLEFICIPD